MSNNADDQYKILIDLTQSTDVRTFRDQREIIQVQAVENIGRLIGRNLDAAGEHDRTQSRLPGLYMDRRHNTITLHGRRGSGKTTFLFNLLDLMQQGKLTGVDPGGLELLGVIDPTLIENKENVFINILSLIKERVDSVYASRRNQSGYEAGEDVEQRYRRWRDSLLKLAGGLTLLDGIGSDNPHGESWENPAYVLEKGLKDAKSGNKLERHFHDFLRDSLEFIGKKAFLLALDDIDTDFRRGWPILEVLRKYLTSRHLIVILSGNLELYSLLVRSKQWDNMPATLRLKDRARWPLYVDMIDELQSQYLQKVLKPENRIEVMPLSYYANTLAPEAIKVAVRGEAKSETLDAFLNFGLLNGFYLHSAKDQRQLKECLLRQPLRSVLQVFHSIAETLVPLRDSQAQSLLDVRKPDVVDAMRRFHETLPLIFLEPLLEKHVPYERLNTATWADLVPMVANFLTRNDAWQEGYRLKAEFTDDEFNLAAVALGSRLARELNLKPSLLMDYFVKIGGSREAILTLPAKNEVIEPSDYVRFVGLESNDSALQVARRSLAVWREDDRGNLDRRISLMGTIALGPRKVPSKVFNRFYNLQETSLGDITLESVNPHIRPFYEQTQDWLERSVKTRRTLGKHYNTLASLQRNITSWHREFVTLPASIVLNGKGDNATYFSIHNLIGIIGEMLVADDPLDVMTKASQLRSFPSPNWGTRSEPSDVDELSTDEEETDYLSSEEIRQRKDVLGFDEAIDLWTHWAKTESWRRAVGEPTPLVPVHVVAKMWTRFYYTLRRIDAELHSSDQFLGNILHRYIIALFNAILVEEDLHRTRGRSVMRLQNPVNSDLNFVENFKRYRQGSHPFFRLLFACPIWSMYLNPYEELGGLNLFREHLKAWRNEFQMSVSGNNEGEVLTSLSAMVQVSYTVTGGVAKFPNLYPLLNSVPVHLGLEAPGRGRNGRPR